MSKFRVAGSPEILRAAQKDEYYLRYLKNLIAELVQKTLGVYHWLKFKNRYDLLGDLIYYYLTSVSGYQTLGEEYVHIIQVDESLKKIPSKMKRILDMIFFTFGTYIFGFFLNYLNKIVKEKRYPLQSSASMTDNIRKQMEDALSIISKSVTYLQRFHLVIFYFFGTFYHISKRFTGIKYVMIRRWLKKSAYEKHYRYLAWITASQLAISFGLDMCNIFSKTISSVPEMEKGRKNANETSVCVKKCALCLEQRIYSTLTPCGHLFCWVCIAEWMQNKEECPLCRENFGPSRLLYLQNYD